MRLHIAIVALILIPVFSSPSFAQEQSGKDCTPYNGPFGFYGNVWCQPPNEQSYLRNLGLRWPMETPPSLRKPKQERGNSTDW